MTDISVMQAEIARWEKDLAALEEERTAEGWTDSERLLFTAQRTIATYRRQVLPLITANRALPDSQAPQALTGYGAILADEINQLVDRLDELSSELIRCGQTAELHLQTAETLAALRALGRVVLRFDETLRQ
jgi:hypothetical protein